MRKKAAGRVVVVERRRRELSDKELLGALALDPESNTFKAMLEVCDRFEDEAMHLLNPDEKPEHRLEAATAVYTARQIRARFLMLNRQARDESQRAAQNGGT